MTVVLKNVAEKSFQKRKRSFIATVADVVGLPVKGIVVKKASAQGKQSLAVHLELHATREYSGFHEVMTTQFQTFFVAKLKAHGFESTGVSVTPPSSMASKTQASVQPSHKHKLTPEQSSVYSKVMLHLHWWEHIRGLELVAIAVVAPIAATFCLARRNRGAGSAKVHEDTRSETAPILADPPTEYAQPGSSYALVDPPTEYSNDDV
jgi:hypothetical protein